MSSDDSYYEDDGYDFQSEGSMYDEPDDYNNDGVASENDDVNHDELDDYDNDGVASENYDGNDDEPDGVASENDDGNDDEVVNSDDYMEHDDDDAQESDMCEDQEEIEEDSDGAVGEEAESDERISEDGYEENDEQTVEESEDEAGSDERNSEEEVFHDESSEEAELDEQFGEEVDYDIESDEEYFDDENYRGVNTDYSDSDDYYAPPNNTHEHCAHNTTTAMLPTAGNCNKFTTFIHPAQKCSCRGKCSFSYEIINVDRCKTEFTFISDEMKKTIQNHQLQENGGGKFSTYNIISIQRVQNNCIWKKFVERSNKLNWENQKLLYHGTTATYKIIKYGFNTKFAKPNGMFGTGIYFAEHSSKSNQYVYGFLGGNGCPGHQDKSCYVCRRKMLLCRVTLGRVYELKQADQSMSQPPASYDSVKGVPTPGGGGLLYPEYAVYDADQIYPEYVITYKIVR